MSNTDQKPDDLQKQFTDMQDMFAPEPLHRDLVPYLVKHDSLGQMIHHRMIISVPHHDLQNKFINRYYIQKKAAIEQALNKDDWARIIGLHERPYRFDAFMEIIELADFDDGSIERATQFWELAGSVWTDSDNIHQHIDGWKQIWLSSIPHRENVMEEGERDALAKMPDTITIWRGTGHAEVAEGLSWTIDKSRAIWFAHRRTGFDNHVPYLAGAKVNKSDVLAYLTGRNEHEVVLLPDRLKELKIRRLPPKRNHI